VLESRAHVCVRNDVLQRVAGELGLPQPMGAGLAPAKLSRWLLASLIDGWISQLAEFLLQVAGADPN